MNTKTYIRRAVTLITVVVFSLTAALPVYAQPGNNDFANAMPISTLPFNNFVDNTLATMENGEPLPSCAWYYDPGYTVWYSYTPTENKTISAFVDNASISPAIAIYTGDSISGLTEIGCRTWDRVTIQSQAGTTYFIQVSSLWGYSGSFRFNLELTPPPMANFGWSPGDPSRFDTVTFYNYSYDPGQIGFLSSEWDFGDGTSMTLEGTGYPSHKYAADGDYSVSLRVTTLDGRIGSSTQTVIVRSHDISVKKLTVPKSASEGQTRTITVGLSSKFYTEIVYIRLYKSVTGPGGGFSEIGFLLIEVPVRPANRTTDINFSYTFTRADADIGKVTFKVEAYPAYSRDLFTADNQLIATTKVSAGFAK